MRLLDCGCGTGHVLQKLSVLLPELKCTGVDCDAHLVAVAQQTLNRELPSRRTILQQSVVALDLPDNSFDFVICRLVLEHLPEPMEALEQVRRVLVGGGKAVFIDNDFDLHERTWPDTPALADLYSAYRQARRSEGGNPCIGRQLPSMLRQAGFEDVQLQVLAAHNEVCGDQAFLRAEGAGIPAQLVNTGFFERSSLDQLANEWGKMLATADH